MNESESALLGGLRAGDASSFETLVRRYSARLIATATRIFGSERDAQDAVQDALVSAWRGIGDFRETSSLYTWLHRITVNACLARLRSAHTKSEVSIADDTHAISFAFEGLPSVWSDSGPSLEKRVAMRRSIQRALDQIPDELRAVLMLRDVEEFSSQEVAAQLGISDAAVRQRLHRARSVMAELLRPELCDGPALTCGGDFDLLLDYIDKCLPPELQQPVHQHLQDCAVCGALLPTYRMTVALPRAILELTSVSAVGDVWIRSTVGRGFEELAHKSADPIESGELY